MSHTPGPWHVDDVANFCAFSADGKRVSYCYSAHSDRSDEEAAANARLIAAAPELLEACKEQIIRLTDLFDRHERPTYNRDAQSDLDLILASGLAAIAKAEGK
jgi:hypothetical protein